MKGFCTSWERPKGKCIYYGCNRDVEPVASGKVSRFCRKHGDVMIKALVVGSKPEDSSKK